jgi:hypothetical protein
MVRVAGESAVVVSRRVVPGKHGPAVLLTCEAAAGAFELLLLRRASTGTAVHLRRNGSELLLHESDLDVIPVPAGVACSRRSSS